MKHLVFLAGIMSLMLLSPDASADGRRWHGYDSHFNHSAFRADRYRGRGYYRDFYPRPYNRHYRPVRRGGSYWNFSFGSGYHHDHLDAGALLGGIVLGSVISQGIASSRYDDRVQHVVPVQSRVQVIQRTPVTVSTPPNRRLLRDLSGRCYEITRDGQGTEVRVELDPSACNF